MVLLPYGPVINTRSQVLSRPHTRSLSPAIFLLIRLASFPLRLIALSKFLPPCKRSCATAHINCPSPTTSASSSPRHHNHNRSSLHCIKTAPASYTSSTTFPIQPTISAAIMLGFKKLLAAAALACAVVIAAGSESELLHTLCLL